MIELLKTAVIAGNNSKEVTSSWSHLILESKRRNVFRDSTAVSDVSRAESNRCL